MIRILCAKAMKELDFMSVRSQINLANQFQNRDQENPIFLHDTLLKFLTSYTSNDLFQKFEGGSPPNDVKSLKKENEELRGHIMEMTDFICDQVI